MLTPGNRKLGGGALIWGFALPSGVPEVCIGMTPACRKHCYAVRTEAYRAAAREKYRRNLELTRLPDFALRMRYFILNHEIRVVRIHTGGEFFSVRYVRQWRRVIAGLPAVHFFAYTRAWRLPTLKRELDGLAALPNLRLWYSCDRDTGLPEGVPARVRLCWLLTEAGEVPPDGVELVFRVSHLRRHPADRVGAVRVCPDENGRDYARKPRCETCGSCWRPLTGDFPADC